MWVFTILTLYIVYHRIATIHILTDKISEHIASHWWRQTLWTKQEHKYNLVLTRTWTPTNNRCHPENAQLDEMHCRLYALANSNLWRLKPCVWFMKGTNKRSIASRFHHWRLLAFYDILQSYSVRREHTVCIHSYALESYTFEKKKIQKIQFWSLLANICKSSEARSSLWL